MPSTILSVLHILTIRQILLLPPFTAEDTGLERLSSLCKVIQLGSKGVEFRIQAILSPKFITMTLYTAPRKSLTDVAALNVIISDRDGEDCPGKGCGRTRKHFTCFSIWTQYSLEYSCLPAVI